MNDGWLFVLLAPLLALYAYAMQEWGALYRIRQDRLVILVAFLPMREIPLQDITRIEVTRRKRLQLTRSWVANAYVSRLFARHVRVRVRDGRKLLLAPADAEAFARDLAFSSGAEAIWVDR